MSPFELGVPLSSLYPRGIARSRSKLVVTLYDLIPQRFPDMYLPDSTVRARYGARTRLIREADHVLAISRTSADDAEELLGIPSNKITVINGGVSDTFRPSDVARSEKLKQVMSEVPEVTGPYILYTGGIEYRKNVRGALEGFAAMSARQRQNYRLVITCSVRPEQRIDLLSFAERLGIVDRVVITGYVSDPILRDLYQGCSVFIFPSLYEGLGLPILEAMRCGAPVLTSDRGSMREIVEVPEARFSPEEPRAIAACLDNVLTQPSLSERLRRYSLERSAQYTWKEVAQRSEECYRSLVGESPRRRRPIHRLRLALCTPFPPQASGIATYNKRFLQALTTKYPVDVDVVVDGPILEFDQPSTRHIQLITASSFSSAIRRDGYDYSVFCMGNSSFHRYIYELLRRHRGVVWLHDIRLSGFYRWLVRTEANSDVVLAGRMQPHLRRNRGMDSSLLDLSVLDQDEAGIYFSEEVMLYASHLLVNSQFAKDLARSELQSSGPISIVPFACPRRAVVGNHHDIKVNLLSAFDIPWHASIVISVGLVWTTKEPEKLIESIRYILTTVRETHIVFVGDCESTYRSSLEALAEREHVSRQVHFTGWVRDDELYQWLTIADCAVQLRQATNGESSAAVADCLAMAVPTLVSAQGPQKELSDVTVQVSPGASPPSLAVEIQRVLTDRSHRDHLRIAATEYAQAHSFETTAAAFWDVLSSDLGHSSANGTD